MVRRWATTALIVLLGIALLWAAGLRNEPLFKAQSSHRLDPGKPLENASPLMVFSTVVLGGFRGIISDILWLRISYLQSRAEYVEIVQLADWIAKLDPRSVETWSYHAWNMAFNVAGVMSDPEDRWRWVENGIRLLRDEALQYDASAAPLYCDLAWMYLFKIGATADRAHLFYRRRLAAQMTALLGGAEPDFDSMPPEVPRSMAQDFKLLPGVMQDLQAKYGRLDWRLPETHALYWAYRGLQVAHEGYEALQCRRLIYQSMAAAVLNGRLAYGAGGDAYRTAPAPDLIPAALKAYDEALAKHPVESVRDAYANFLARAVRTLHGVSPGKAREIFELLCARFPSPETAGGYERFVANSGSDKRP